MAMTILYEGISPNKTQNLLTNDDFIVLNAIAIGENVSLDDIFKRVRSHSFSLDETPVFGCLNLLVKNGAIIQTVKNGTLYFCRQ